ncbi:MAG: hypothetical protein F6K41_14000 [Symploca sp. SIO3E6]|nr:hypothetical protein [Caldora sp. SIO3E6]
MISREHLKLEIDAIDDAYIEILHRIILALKQPFQPPHSLDNPNQVNPLKDSVLFEKDLISPIDVSWEADQ